MKLCSIDGCDRKFWAKKMCAYHYERVRYGYPLWPTRRPKGTGSITTQGYMSFGPNHKLEHRMVMEKILGRAMLPLEQVHHKNGNRLDNRPENLELWSKSQPAGARVEDLMKWAREILDTYS